MAAGATAACSAIFCCWLRVNLVGAGGVGGSFPHSSSNSFNCKTLRNLHMRQKLRKITSNGVIEHSMPLGLQFFLQTKQTELNYHDQDMLRLIFSLWTLFILLPYYWELLKVMEHVLNKHITKQTSFAWLCWNWPRIYTRAYTGNSYPKKNKSTFYLNNINNNLQ